MENSSLGSVLKLNHLAVAVLSVPLPGLCTRRYLFETNASKLLQQPAHTKAQKLSQLTENN